MEIYVVAAGDSVDAIANRFGVSASSVIYNNQLVYPYRLTVGQSLLIGTPQTGPDTGKREIVSSGYAYPFIGSWVLGQTLPYLTELFVFSYGFTPEGRLVAPEADDGRALQAALEAGTKPYLTLTPFGADGMFNNYLVSILVNDPQAIAALIDSLASLMPQKGYEGVNIDFEYINAEDRDAFTEFVRIMTEAMNSLGYEVSVALAPRTFEDQPGRLTAGQDYAGIGQAANHVLLMSYEWGYTYSEPRAVAPVNLVRRVAEYAAAFIEPGRTSLGIPNYGYDWTLPYIRGVSRARTIGNVEAVQTAIRYQAPIRFDDTAQTPWYRYTDETAAEHEVWFEDARSMRAKYELIAEYGLRGIGCWQIMQLFRVMWLLLADMYWIL